ncbi:MULTISPECIES: SusC/RagA family TonB-linked outer membrane protein [unclassified Pedobacter]|uniref:SusC/RagA family TonB-linked outer membrane protein n=1 Tax=unclassified Pedobacter TaxID=2628915 RepID=UPI001D3A0B22|nr:MULTISPECIES: SusC/RagA family TonB-linked outer membrane protein [unclassified Pedobacter]CAH0131442.1 TonB-dependent receptor SusC [Pedobacter sp. Bi126]CAH0226900.1 TonB-dependent receptor SusC [Pedobacter sp. Bi36]
MYNFTTIKKVWGILLCLLVFGLAAQAQEVDSMKTETDTTTVKVKARAVRGEKIKGVVLDGNTNKPLVGINITVTGFNAAITDEKGRFTVVVPDYKASIIISGNGFQTKVLPVYKDKEIRTKLYPLSFASVYNEVVTPIGTVSQARAIPAISNVSLQGNWASNSESVMSYIQGRAAGVKVTRRSGTPGVGADVLIRGFNSLYATNQPLYVVDGMIFDANNYGTSLIKGHVNNPLQFIDVRDIENISIIKDAALAATYGVKAANGVVLITTNRAHDLATNIDFSGYAGFNFKPKNLPVMGASDYRLYLSDILKSQGLSNSAIAAKPYMNDSPTNPDYFKYHNETNWQNEVLKSSFDQNYFLKVTGGDNIAKYALSAAYARDRGVIDSTDNLKYSTRFNSDLNLTKKLQGSTSLSFTYTEQRLKDQGVAPVTNPLFLALVKSPFMARNEINSTGAVSPNLADYDTLQVSNPRALIEKGQNLKKAYRFYGNINFDFTFNKNFKISNLSGVTYDKTQETLFIPRKGVTNDTLSNYVGDSRLGTQVGRFFNVFNDLRLTYDQSFGSYSKLHAIVGTRYSQSESEQDYALGFNSATDELISIGNSNAAFRTFGGDIGKWRTLNNYLSANYSYADKYLVNFSMAVDGSSRFGAKAGQGFLNFDDGLRINGSRYAVLPALGAAWVISSEKFMRNLHRVDLLKLRMSYGLVGNDDVGNYTARKYYTSQNVLGIRGIVTGNFANPNLQWETVHKFNTGIDGSFFSERLSISLDYWRNSTKNMLSYQLLSVVTGTASFINNNGGMQTNGLDLSLNGRILNEKLKWDAGLTIGTSTNKITSLPDGNSVITSYAGGAYISQVGQSANQFYGYKTNGVFATNAEAAASGLSSRNSLGALVPFTGGDVKFTDSNGDKIIDDADRTVIGNPNPNLFGSFNNTFTYKNWSLDALITFVSGNDVYNYTRAQLESGSTYYNQTPNIGNRWKGDGQVTSVPKATYGDPVGNARFSDRWIEDGSYLRLRTVNVTYNVPLKLKAIKYAKIYATANNLFTVTNYLGYDPEFSNSGSLFSQGVDTTLEPQFRSFQLGVRVGL